MNTKTKTYTTWYTSLEKLVASVACLGLLMAGAMTVQASSTSNFQVTVNSGTLSVDIADSTSSFATVASPTVGFAAQTFSFNCGSTTGTFGTATESIYVVNPDAADNGWSVTLAASAATAVWDSAGSTAEFDFNDTNDSGCTDGSGDTDTASGRLTVDPSGGTIATGGCDSSNCNISDISLGSSAAYDEGTTDSVTIATGAADSNDIGDWAITGVALTQTIPAEQPAHSDYSLNMTLTVAAS